MQGERVSAGPFEVAETRHRGGLVLGRHAHESACLHFVLEGVYQEATDRGEQEHAARTLVYKPGGEPHWNRFSADGSRTLRVELSPAPDTPDPRIGPTSSADPLLVELAARLHDEVRRPDELTPLSVEGICLEILARLGRGQAPLGTLASRDAARRAARLLEERYPEPVRFDELARELRVNRSHLARSFRALHRCTMGDYLRRLRVEHVRAALLRSDRPLAEIAASAGFADQSHCARLFRRLVGVTPGRFREGLR